MALIKCVECGKEISDKVDSCIHCGCLNYKKQYNENELRSKIDFAKALMLLIEIKGIKDYQEPTISDKNSFKYFTSWLSVNCRRLSKDIDLETVALLSDNSEKDFESFHSVINHEIELKNIMWYGKDDNGVRPVRVIARCNECGLLQAHRDSCIECFNDSFIDIEEVFDFTRNEKMLLHRDIVKFAHIVNSVFDEIKPKEYIGCIEICDYLKDKYGLDDSIYEIIAVFNYLMKECEHANILNEYGYSCLTKDSRRFTYYLATYTTEKVNDLQVAYWKCDEETKKEIKDNTKEVIVSITENISKLKQYSKGKGMTGNFLYDYDFDYSLEDIQDVRSKCIASYENENETQISNAKRQDEYHKKIEERNRIVEEITKPMKNTDPNYVESATCPNCHKNSVYRISNVKRGASIGLFGLFSKNIGKTMECRSCGYKW